MNTRVWLFLLSLGVNAWLLASVLAPRPTGDSARPAPTATAASGKITPAKPTLPPPTPKRTRAASDTNAAPAAATTNAAAAFHWSSIESADFADYIARLRGIGCPEWLIRSLIMGEVEKLYAPRRAALVPKPDRSRYWENNRFSEPEARLPKPQREQLYALEQEQRTLLRSLLGEDFELEQAREFGGLNGDNFDLLAQLTPEQRRRLREIDDEHDRSERELNAANGGNNDQEDERELHQLKQRRRQALATLLTPEQLEELELRTSDTAHSLRYQLRNFNATEAEFRAVHRYKSVVDEVNMANADAADSPEPTPAQQKLQQEREAAVAALAKELPEDRLKEFKLREDGNNRQLFEFGLGAADVRKIAALKESAEKTVRELRTNQTLPPEQREQAASAIRAATEAELGTLMDERHVNAYLRNGGQWIRNIAPRPLSPVPTPP